MIQFNMVYTFVIWSLHGHGQRPLRHILVNFCCQIWRIQYKLKLNYSILQSLERGHKPSISFHLWWSVTSTASDWWTNMATSVAMSNHDKNGSVQGCTIQCLYGQSTICWKYTGVDGIFNCALALAFSHKSFKFFTATWKSSRLCSDKAMLWLIGKQYSEVIAWSIFFLFFNFRPLLGSCPASAATMSCGWVSAVHLKIGHP